MLQCLPASVYWRMYGFIAAMDLWGKYGLISVVPHGACARGPLGPWCAMRSAGWAVTLKVGSGTVADVSASPSCSSFGKCDVADSPLPRLELGLGLCGGLSYVKLRRYGTYTCFARASLADSRIEPVSGLHHLFVEELISDGAFIVEGLVRSVFMSSCPVPCLNIEIFQA